MWVCASAVGAASEELRTEALNYLAAWVSSSVWHVLLMSSELILSDIHWDLNFVAFLIITAWITAARLRFDYNK